MVMKFGERWHCMDPGCHCEVLVTTSGAVDGLNPRCACGSIMKKPYVKPTIAHQNNAVLYSNRNPILNRAVPLLREQHSLFSRTLGKD
jgi:hypothetical protein